MFTQKGLTKSQRISASRYLQILKERVSERNFLRVYECSERKRSLVKINKSFFWATLSLNPQKIRTTLIVLGVCLRQTNHPFRAEVAVRGAMVQHDLPSKMWIIVRYDGDIIGIIMESYFIPSGWWFQPL